MYSATRQFIPLVLLFLVTLHHCSAYKGLMIMSAGTKSHFHFYKSVVDSLAQAGHQIVFITPYKLKPVNPNVTEVLLEDDYIDKILGNPFESSFFQFQKTMTELIPEICTNAMVVPEVKKATEKDYDYIMMPLYFTDCFLNSVHEKQVPLIYLTPNVLMNPISERIGAPEFGSFTPNKFLTFTAPMTFWERVVSAIADAFTDYTTKYVSDASIDQLCRKLNLWTPETPSIWDLQKLGNLTIVNSIRALDSPVKATPPTVVYAGGIHIKPTKSLPKDLEEWISDSGKEGFILFSLGSAVKSSYMTKEHIEIVLQVFGRLKQRVLWKWDADEIPSLPRNVRISRWLPQQDLLAHPKIRLFITHGGLFSTQEATYFGVPVIGMPLFGDQASNVAKIVSEGWGRQVSWKTLMGNEFENTIQEVITNSSLRSVVDARSKLMKDWPLQPSHEIQFWVNYVLRHKGAKHLQSPLINLPWYQINNVDTWLFVIGCVLVSTTISLFVFIYCLKFCFRKCFGKTKTD